MTGQDDQNAALTRFVLAGPPPFVLPPSTLLVGIKSTTSS